jgi:hypothetical protein
MGLSFDMNSNNKSHGMIIRMYVSPDNAETIHQSIMNSIISLLANGDVTEESIAIINGLIDILDKIIDRTMHPSLVAQEIKRTNQELWDMLHPKKE